MRAGQDDALQPALRELADERVADVVGMDLAVDVRLADASGDQLCHLRAEVEDEDLVVVHVVGRGTLGTRTGRFAKWRAASRSAAACSSAQKYNGAPMRQSPWG